VVYLYEEDMGGNNFFNLRVVESLVDIEKPMNINEICVSAGAINCLEYIAMNIAKFDEKTITVCINNICADLRKSNNSKI